MANLPLVASGRTIGALMATWSAPRDFDEDELRFLQTLAGQAALAIERAQLLLLLYTDGLIEQRNRGLTQGLEVLLELAAVVAGDDLERACDEIPRRVLGDEPREDDMCLLAVRATPQGAAHRLTFAQWLSGRRVDEHALLPAGCGTTPTALGDAAVGSPAAARETAPDRTCWRQAAAAPADQGTRHGKHRPA